MCVGFGAAEMSEAYSGHNVIRDDLMKGNELVYNTVRNSAEAVASVATLAVSAASAANSAASQCFVAGTPVLASDETIPIETVLAGMQVWAMDPETGEKALKTVVRTFVNESDELIHVHTGAEEIICTPEHPFYVPAKGWTGAAQLRAGDILVLSNGSYVTVEKIQHEILEDPVKVYNFEVEDFHTYFVGESSVLVHNDCPQQLVAGNKQEWNARVSVGGETNHAMGHAHVFWKHQKLASVNTKGEILVGHLPKKGVKFVQNNMLQIAKGIEKWYYKK